ncbi:hypothetical protein KDA_52020 [Dictyobacter alpinus]|uniref:Uncharacterized protein n=1 Tax=Dictyobacter alpinus TaxID=2014873 RepID=A0A402BE94_9CHLR|nr:hypothetical protein KDA_52020 [Dictyobacter alpinus]
MCAVAVAKVEDQDAFSRNNNVHMPDLYDKKSCSSRPIYNNLYDKLL